MTNSSPRDASVSAARQQGVSTGPCGREQRRRTRRVIATASTTTCLLVLAACARDSTTPTGVAVDEALWSLQLSQHAVMLALAAPYDTIQLTATASTGSGAPLAVPAAVRFTASDSTISVTPAGLVTAHYPTRGRKLSYVIAEVTDARQNLTAADTAFFEVSAAAPSAPVQSLSLQATDSACRILWEDSCSQLTAAARDSAGATIPNLLVAFRSSDASVARFGNVTSAAATVYAGRAGRATLIATASIYGVTARDSLAFAVLAPPLTAAISVIQTTPYGSTKPVSGFWPEVASVATGGTVSWRNGDVQSCIDNDTPPPIDIVFDDSVDVAPAPQAAFFPVTTGGGNIDPFTIDSIGTTRWADSLVTYIDQQYPPEWRQIYFCNWTGFRVRSFPKPGTYHYHSTLFGTTGTIIVADSL